MDSSAPTSRVRIPSTPSTLLPIAEFCTIFVIVFRKGQKGTRFSSPYNKKSFWNMVWYHNCMPQQQKTSSNRFSRLARSASRSRCHFSACLKICWSSRTFTCDELWSIETKNLFCCNSVSTYLPTHLLPTYLPNYLPTYLSSKILTSWAGALWSIL